VAISDPLCGCGGVPLGSHTDCFPTTEEVTAMADKKITQHRSAKTGEFVTKQYAEKHKSTTVTERNNAPKPSRSKSRGK